MDLFVRHRCYATVLTASAGTALLLCLSGCAALEVRLGTKVRLEQTPVVSMKVDLPNARGIAPGQKLPLVVTVTKPDGTVLLTEGKGGGKVLWSDLALAADVVEVNRKGFISLASDPRKSDG